MRLILFLIFFINTPTQGQVLPLAGTTTSNTPPRINNNYTKGVKLPYTANTNSVKIGYSRINLKSLKQLTQRATQQASWRMSLRLKSPVYNKPKPTAPTTQPAPTNPAPTPVAPRPQPQPPNNNGSNTNRPAVQPVPRPAPGGGIAPAVLLGMPAARPAR